ncbi:MAG: pantoate--beta-alanine ligase [Bacteroidales bacterium]
MEIVRTISETKAIIEKIKAEGKTIGFVPTMGALHAGHISLQERSHKENDFTVCSIFVNPIQFNNAEDLEKYPRTEERDIEMLEKAGCHLVFIPSVNEMYGEKEKTVYDFGHLDKILEGEFRPGHFNGVAIVVKKLFDIVTPHKAYFGEKDYQQLAIVKQLVRMHDIPVEIVPCPTMREPSGLAMSSRNERLSLEEKEIATILYRTLKQTVEKTSELTPEECENWAIQQINAAPGMSVEYFSIVDAETMLPVKKWHEGQQVVACVAAFIGEVRLIDNMMIFS